MHLTYTTNLRQLYRENRYVGPVGVRVREICLLSVFERSFATGESCVKCVGKSPSR